MVVGSEYVRFWKVVQDNAINRDGDRWTLHNDVKWIGGARTMFIRKCYVTLANLLLSENEPVTDHQAQQSHIVPPVLPPNWQTTLVLGAKGIGKTMFLNYLIVRILDKHRKPGASKFREIVYCRRIGTADKRIHFATNSVTFADFSGGQYFISDSVDITESGAGTELTLEVTSEDESNYKNFRQRVTEANGERYYMYAWSLAELLVVRPVDLTIDEAQFLYDVFGGIVRYFLGGSTRTVPDDDDVIEHCANWYFHSDFKDKYPVTWSRALQQIRQVFDDAKGKTTKAELAFATSMFWHSHKQGTDAPDRHESGFSSKFLEYLAGHIKDTCEATVWGALSEMFGNSVKGVIFESIGHNKLTSTDKIYTAHLLNKKNGNPFQIRFFGMQRFLIRTIEDIRKLDDGTYGLPLFGNYPLVDAIIQPNVLLQFTVSDTHGKVSHISKYAALRNGLREKNYNLHKLIFVIPASKQGNLHVVGVPQDLACYWMCYEDVVDETVLTGDK